MKHKIVKTKDMRLFNQAVDELLNRANGIEGGGLLWGRPGVGKTTAVAYMVNQYRGVFVRALGCWSVTTMLGDLCHELGGKRLFRRADMVDFIVTELSKPGEAPRPIFIDEADYCVRDIKMIDTIRDIYDLSKCPIILIGMEDFVRQVRTNERVSRRISQWVEFRGLDLADTALVAEECCEVSLASDLLEFVHKETGANIGRIIIGLTRIEKFAKANNLSTITAAEWGNRPLYFDQPYFAGKGK